MADVGRSWWPMWRSGHTKHIRMAGGPIAGRGTGGGYGGEWEGCGPALGTGRPLSAPRGTRGGGGPGGALWSFGTRMWWGLECRPHARAGLRKLTTRSSLESDSELESSPSRSR